MKSIKRNSSQNFPIKLNYKPNDLLFSYRSGKLSSELQLINVNKTKYLEENKSFSSFSKNSKNVSYIFSDINIKNKKNKINLSSINSYNNIFQSFIDEGTVNHKYYNSNTNYYSYKTKTNDSYNSKFIRKDNSNISNKNSIYNNTISNVNHSNNIYNSIFSYKRTKINNRNTFNKKQIYQKPKNEKTLSSYSLAITDYNSNKSKENISIKSNYNLDTNSNYKYNNFKKFNKNNTKTLPHRFTDLPRNINTTFKSIKTSYYQNETKNNTSFFDERKTNIDYSKLNLYSPKTNKENYIKKDMYYVKRTRVKLKSDIIKCNTGDNINFSGEKNYRTNNDINNRHSFIYVRKKSSNKHLINNSKVNKSSFSSNNNSNVSKIRVNLKYKNVLENAYFVQKKVILIQKYYRMHLACLKKYILISIKRIIQGTNILYFIFYKNYCRKFIFILNNAYIKSININIKNAKIIPKLNDNKSFHFSRPKYYYILDSPEKNKILDIKENIDMNNNNEGQSIIETKSQSNSNTNINKIKEDMDLIRNLKNQIVNKLNMLKK